MLLNVLVTPRKSTSSYIDDSISKIQDQKRRFSYNYCNYLQSQQPKSYDFEIQPSLIRKNKIYTNENIEDDLFNDYNDFNFDEYDDDLFEDDDKMVFKNQYSHKNSIKTKFTTHCDSNQIEFSNFNHSFAHDTSNSSSSISSPSRSPINLHKTRTLSEKILRNNNYIINVPDLLHKNKKKVTRQELVSSYTSNNNYHMYNNSNDKFFLSSISSKLSSTNKIKKSDKILSYINNKNNTFDSQIFLNNLTKTTSEAFSQQPPLPFTSQPSLLMEYTDIDHSIQNSLKNFSHFDINSIFFNYEHVKLIKSSLFKSFNINTGASAASQQSGFGNLDTENRNSRDFSFIFQDNSIDLKQANTDELNNLTESSIYNKNISTSKNNLKDFILVQNCPYFCIERGGDTFKGLGLIENFSQRKMMKLNSVSILDKIKSYYKKEVIDLIAINNNEPFTIEFQNCGSYFYRYFFYNQDHSNYLGIDSKIGPVAISIRKEKITVDSLSATRTNSDNPHRNKPKNNREYHNAYRIIMRTCDLNTLKGTILEDQIMTKSSTSNNKGSHHKDIIGNLFNEIDLDCLYLAEPKVADKLLDLDEQYIIKTHKIGVLLCKPGQSSEEEFYNNQETTPAFDEFLKVLGDRIRLKGFNNYRGGLDTTSDTTGTHSIYTKFRGQEIMFHVSTYLPYSINDKQQLTRKRHIGNDLVTIIFQESGSSAFSPKAVRSQYQHIFIIVRVINQNSKNTQYTVAVSYSKDVPSFGPPLPKNPLFIKSKEFRDFLLTKLINADNVGLHCEKFTQIRMRNRHGALKDIVENYSSKINIENSGSSTIGIGVVQKLNFFNLSTLKHKKRRSKSLHMFNPTLINILNDDFTNVLSLHKLNGAILWSIEAIEDYQYKINHITYFGISKEFVVIVDPKQKCVLFVVGCKAIIGWTFLESNLNLVLYFDRGEYVNMKFSSKSDVTSIIKRLEYFTKGCKTNELCLEKIDYGPLGLNIHHDGVITQVEPYSLAYYRGLKQGTRLVKIGDCFVINLNHEKMIDLLRKSSSLKVTFLPPFEDGSSRTGQDDNNSVYAYLSTCTSLNERVIDSLKTPFYLYGSSNNLNFEKPFHLSLSTPQKSKRLPNVSDITKYINRLSISTTIKNNTKNVKLNNSLNNAINENSSQKLIQSNFSHEFN